MIHRRNKEWAAAAWQRIIGTLPDGAQNFGPDYDSAQPPGEYWWEVNLGGEAVGMVWARRFTKSGGVMNYGRGLFAEYRHKYPFATRYEYLRETVHDLYTQVPQCQTVICIAWSTNETSLRACKKRLKEIGVIPQGNDSMHIFLVHTRTT